MTTTTVVNLLHLDQVDQYKTSNGGFKWKMIENKLKIDKKKKSWAKKGIK